MKEKISNCTAAILCGGKSSRMGFDKALMTLGGESLLKRCYEGLEQLFEQVVLVSNSREKLTSGGEFLSQSIVVDHYQNKGPIGGICTVLEETAAPYIFVMACDMPKPNLNLILRMYREIQDAQIVLCEHSGGVEPLFAFYHRSCLPVFKQQIEENQLQIRRKFDQLKLKKFFLEDENLISGFVNLNTKKELEEWKSQKSDK